MSVDPSHHDDDSDDDLSRRAKDEETAAERAQPVPANASTETLKDSVAPTGIPKRIGHYHLKRVIASGGMGTVYEAIQKQPRRTVALKLMKHGIASRSALRRFEYESQILARLRHPGIAQVYEAGTHRDDSGTVPYFAMEYIVGAKPITQYVKEKKLGTRASMELFAQTCDAVNHGHQKGIIHRDLKPSNILVDASGQVKIIDFGVARSTDSDLAVTTLQTDIGQLIGTLQYMSPEQCEADPHNIDTRSDVYALGVVFYELLCGKLPYNVTRVAMHEATRIIREQHPTKLSTLNKALRGDVETIALKALEKDRERRYQSATDFDQDIRRYLNNEAITARPTSMLYQFRVLVRRNKPIFGAVAAVFVVLVGATIVSTSLYVQSQREALKAQTTLEFLEKMLRNANPFRADNEGLTLAHLLSEASKDLDAGDLSAQPEIEAHLRLTLMQTYYFSGHYAAAESEAAKSIAFSRRLWGDEHRNTLLGRYARGLNLWKLGRHHEAETILRSLLEPTQRTLGEEDWLTRAVLKRLHVVLVDSGRAAEAEPYGRRVLEIWRRVLGEDDGETLFMMNNLAEGLLRLGKLHEAEGLLSAGLDLARRNSVEGRGAAQHFLMNLAEIKRQRGKWVAAEQLVREAVELFSKNGRDIHPDSQPARMIFALTLRDQGRLDEAEVEARKAWESRHRFLGAEHSHTLDSLALLVSVLGAQGELERSRELAVSLSELLKRRASRPRATPRELHDYARMLLTCPLNDLRKPAAALPYALGAVKGVDATDYRYLATLALAQHRTGDSLKASESQENALSLLPPEETTLRAELEATLAKYRAAAEGESTDHEQPAPPDTKDQ